MRSGLLLFVLRWCYLIEEKSKWCCLKLLNTHANISGCGAGDVEGLGWWDLFINFGYVIGVL